VEVQTTLARADSGFYCWDAVIVSTLSILLVRVPVTRALIAFETSPLFQWRGFSPGEGLLGQAQEGDVTSQLLECRQQEFPAGSLFSNGTHLCGCPTA
jgi:hypothetical protein